MFKFLKEILIDPIKDGIAEAKQELADEEIKAQETTEEKSLATQKQQIETIPYEEKFYLAIAAPFRVTVFQDWFSVFKNNTDYDDHYPLHLYTFGDARVITQQNKNDLSDVLKRDFNITDRDSALKTVAAFLKPFSICNKLTEYQSNDFEDMKKSLELLSRYDMQSTQAVTCCIAAHILTASTDVGYLDKSFSKDVLADVMELIKANFSSWQSFSDCFLQGETLLKLNKGLGKKLLIKYVNYLREKKGSPWNIVPWEYKYEFVSLQMRD